MELLPEPEARDFGASPPPDSRRSARVTPEGDLIPLEEQDRSLWNRASVDEGCDLVGKRCIHAVSVLTLQAAIAAVHAEARSPQETNWAEIAGLYDALLRLEPSPIVHLNRAVAVAMRDGPEAGLVLIALSSTKAALAITALPTRQKPIYCAASGASLRPRPAMRRRWPSRSRSPNSGSSSAAWPKSAANARKFFRAPVNPEPAVRPVSEEAR